MAEKENENDDQDNNISRIIPKSEYDFEKAKEKASVKWLLGKAYSVIPSDLQEPYYMNENEELLKPIVVHKLASAELYCLAMCNIYRDPNYGGLGHRGVLQALSGKSIFVVEPVTETVLIQTAPFKMSAHLAMIDAIIAAYIREFVSIEKIVQCIRRYTCVNASLELPADLEQALIFWVSKVCTALREQLEKEAQENKFVPVDPSHIPNLSKPKSDVINGCCLAALIHFYCPDCLRLEDICFKENMDFADCIYNWQLIRNFCIQHLPSRPFDLSFEDIIYSHESIWPNVIVFLAELFYWTEINRASCVRDPITKEFRSPPTFPEGQYESDDSVASRPKTRPLSLISNATKRSFSQNLAAIPDLRSSLSTSNPEIHKVGSLGKLPSPHSQTLLSRRQNTKRNSMHEEAMQQSDLKSPTCSFKKSLSLGSNDLQRNSKPLIAWPERAVNGPDYYHRSKSDTDSRDIEAVRRNGQLTYRVDHIIDQSLAEYADENNYEMSPDARRAYHESMEPLMPARLKPAKEKYINDSKWKESGETFTKKHPPSKHKDHWSGDEAESQDYNYHESLDMSDNQLLDYKIQGDMLHFRDPDESYISNEALKQGAHLLRTRPVGQSFVFNDRLITPEDALALGLPIVDDGYNSLSKQIEHALIEKLEPDKKYGSTTFAELSKWRHNLNNIGNNINFVYMQHETDNRNLDNRQPLKSSLSHKSNKEKEDLSKQKKTSFAALPNTTTWGQQSQKCNNPAGREQGDGSNEPLISSDLHLIRLKLEEKRRRMELEKKRIEMQYKKQRQRMGKTAFLHVVKGKSSPDGSTSSRESPTHQEEGAVASSLVSSLQEEHSQMPQSILSMQEIEQSLDTVRQKWFRGNEERSSPVHQTTPERVSPNYDNMNLEDYSTNLDRLNLSLVDIQADISRLIQQQEMMQRAVREAAEAQSRRDQQQSQQGQFFLHQGQPPSNQPFIIRSPPQSQPLIVSQAPNVYISPTVNENGFATGQYTMRPTGSSYPAVSQYSPMHVMTMPSHVQHVSPQSFHLHDTNTIMRPSLSQQQLVQTVPQPNFNIPETTATHSSGSPDVKPSFAHSLQSAVVQNEPPQPELTSLDSFKYQTWSEEANNDENSSGAKDGFFVQFDESQPRRPKPRLKSTQPRPMSVPNTREKTPISDELHSLEEGSIPRTSVSEHTPTRSHTIGSDLSCTPEAPDAVGFIVGDDATNIDPNLEDEMQKKKERIMMSALRRKEKQELERLLKEQEAARKREESRTKQEESERKKEDERLRRQLIFEQYQKRKAEQEVQKEGKDEKTISKAKSKPSSAKAKAVQAVHDQPFSQQALSEVSSTSSSPRSRAEGSSNYSTAPVNALLNLTPDRADSPGLAFGGLTNRRPPSPARANKQGSPALSGNMGNRAKSYSDVASDSGSTVSSQLEYTGPKLFVKPTSKSNRSIIHNAISHCCLAGSVNEDLKKKVLDELMRSESKHFLILFRDAGCQFRGLYSYEPENEDEVIKIFGQGPKQVTNKMTDKLYKYNSGGKCFSIIPSKHLSVQVDAFTIHNSLWQGKKVVPSKKTLF